MAARVQRFRRQEAARAEEEEQLRLEEIRMQKEHRASQAKHRAAIVAKARRKQAQERAFRRYRYPPLSRYTTRPCLPLSMNVPRSRADLVRILFVCASLRREEQEMLERARRQQRDIQQRKLAIEERRRSGVL